jgi:hypothetical protein
MDTLKHFEDIIKYHNPNLDDNKLFWLAHDMSMYYDAMAGCQIMIEKADGKRPDLVKERQKRKKMYRAQLKELEKEVGILVEYAGGYIYSDAETKRMNDISEKEFRKANAHLYKEETA